MCVACSCSCLLFSDALLQAGILLIDEIMNSLRDKDLEANPLDCAGFATWLAEKLAAAGADKQH